MQDVLDKLINAPAEAHLVLALFAGATIHAIRLKQIPVAEGLTGAIVSFFTGFFLLKLIFFLFKLNFGDAWLFGFPVAYLANYVLGGMDTVGAQIRDTPVQFIVSTLGTIADEALDKWDKISARFKSTPK